MTPKQWTAPCALPLRRDYRRIYERDTARSREDGAMFEALRAAVEMDDDAAESELRELLAGCSDDDIDELAALAEMDMAEMDGDE